VCATHTLVTDFLESFWLRALAASVIAEVASIEDSIAATAVVEGNGDNGIDAISVDPAEKVCYTVQAKWVKSSARGC